MKPISTYVRVMGFSVLLGAVALSASAQRRSYIHRAVQYYPSYGQRFVHMPGPYVSINFGGNPYYYSGGMYYRPAGNYFQVAFPPFGLRVNMLPTNYYPIGLAGNPYYYSNGVFYRPSSAGRDYEVVQAPVGAEVPSLPSETKTMVIDGEKYYSLNGTYFKDVVKSNGELWYKVVGKNGVLNTFRNPEYNSQPQPAPQQQYPQSAPRQYQQQQQEEPVYANPQPAQHYPQSVPQQQPAPQPQQQDVQPAAPVQPAVQPATKPQPAQQIGGVREAVRRVPGQPQPKQDIDDDMEMDSTQYTAPDLILHDSPGLGWVVDRLPQNCKSITISNKKYFVAPDNTYYEEFVDGRQVRYKVVGK